MSQFITSTQAAKLLGVTRRTLLRWEEREWLCSQRNKQGYRIYRADHVRWAKRVSDEWNSIRRRHREHLRLLPAIQGKFQRFIVTTSLERTKDPTPFDLEEMKKAFRAMNEWSAESLKIHKIYTDFYESEVLRSTKLLAKGIEAESIK